MIHQLESTPRAVIALATDYEDGTYLPPHSHQRSQFLYSMQGMMDVTTSAGKWLVLPYRGVWIPAGEDHSVTMLNASTRSLYINTEDHMIRGKQCEVVTVSPLLHFLLLEAVKLPLLYEESGRDGALISLLLHEVRLAKSLPFYTPLPQHPALLVLCQTFIQAPTIASSPHDWAQQMNRSLRTFSRFFQAELGMTFGEWRQHVVLMSALMMLGKNLPITTIALTLGYESLSAFSAMFKKALGRSPSEFMKSA